MPLFPLFSCAKRASPILAILVAALALCDLARAETSGALATPIALPTLSPLVKRVIPSVVNIIAENTGVNGAAPADAGDEQTPFDDFMRHYFERHGLPGPAPTPARPTGQKTVSLGSGFIIDPAGYIVTNNHVIARATKVTVVFQDNSRHLATIAGTDPKTDLAVLKIATKTKLPALQWGDSDKVEVGDWVMAVGNPFGLGGTVTAGIVSALGRDIQQGPFDDFLQIDAPINRGSSGGPTFDVSGRVVGINTAIYSPTGSNIGIGFAIPSSIGRLVVKHLQEEGHANHGYLGISVQLVGPEIAGALHMDPNAPQGLIIVDITPNSPAEQAGLEVGDVIKRADGHPTLVAHDVAGIVGKARVGDKLMLDIDRDGAALKIAATIATAVRTDPTAVAAAPVGFLPANVARGLSFVPLTADLRQEAHLEPSARGVVIGAIEKDSPGMSAGLLVGDVVLSIARQSIAEPDAAARRLQLVSGTGDVLLLINRDGTKQFIALPGGAEKAAP